jgi:Kef-type K+ transport system membrane component KefB
MMKRRAAGILLLLALLFFVGAAPAEGAGVRPEQFFLVLIAILVVGKGFGELAERIGQPAVLGELLAGVALGASVLGIVPHDGPIAGTVAMLAEVGVAILLFEIGLETDLREMSRVGPSATIVAMVGVLVPFVLGFLFWHFTRPGIGSHPGTITDTLVAVFAGATLTATSVGITARVLTDLNRIHTPEARVIIGAAVVDDVLGLVILAIVSGLAAGAALGILGIVKTFIIAVGFLVAAVLVGNWIAPRLFSIIDQLRVRGVLLVGAFSFALLFGALAGLAGSAMIIGSFAAGVVLSSTNQFDVIEEKIKPVADIFTPIFFVSVGTAVDVRLFLPWSDRFSWGVLGVGFALLFIAVVGKVIAGFTVGWRKQRLNHLAVGVGMVPRGEVGLIFAQVGLTAHILSSEVFSAILIMVIFSTFMAPPLLKVIFRRGKPGEEHEPLPIHPGAAEIETARARWS